MEYAFAHGLTPPTVTSDQHKNFAQDKDAFLQWKERVQASLEAQRTPWTAEIDSMEEDNEDDDNNKSKLDSESKLENTKDVRMDDRLVQALGKMNDIVRRFTARLFSECKGLFLPLPIPS